MLLWQESTLSLTLPLESTMLLMMLRSVFDCYWKQSPGILLQPLQKDIEGEKGKGREKREEPCRGKEKEKEKKRAISPANQQ